jgi:hypothetical protein
VDHINNDGLDCRKQNLRLATRSQNGANRDPFRCRKTSRYKGVFYRYPVGRRAGRWVAQIRVNLKTIGLGCFTDEKDAVEAYNRAARQYFKQFARPNLWSGPSWPRGTPPKSARAHWIKSRPKRKKSEP